jgi:hypothetical protein
VLLVVLETLAPAERLAFVLHDMFAVPFEEITPIVGRSPTAARQLASDPLFSFDPGEAEHIIEAWLASAVEQPERGFTRPEIEKDVCEEYITFSWLLEPMLERADFAIQDARHHASRCYSAYTCVSAR